MPERLLGASPVTTQGARVHVQPTLIVTLPLETLRMLNPTVGIMSSLNWPD